MTIRDQRQAEFAQIAIDNQLFGILYLCPRFGKIYTAINIMEKLNIKRVLIAIPDNNIKKDWMKDFKQRGYDSNSVVFTTHLSLHKHVREKWEMVILDEIHLLSENQLVAAQELLELNKRVIGLTGTMTKWTEKTILEELGMPVICRYSISQGIEEGVIADYEIEVVKTPLDTKILTKNKRGKLVTEKRTFDAYSWVIKKEMEEESPSYNKLKTLRLARMRVIQGSVAKLEATRKMIRKYQDERILVFCGLAKIADRIGCPVYHSIKKEQQIFDDFALGKGKHLAVIKMGNTGKTYKPLNRVIVNYFNSNGENLAQQINRCMAMEYDNPGKKAYVTIISSTEPVEQKWLNTALEFFDKSKIKYTCV